MTKTSYKSSAQKATDAAVIPGARAPAPPELEPEAVPLWVEIVNRLPADWVVSENKVLLREYCRHALYADAFARDIAAVRAQLDELAVGLQPDRATLTLVATTTEKLHELHRMHGFETDRLVTLATKMRFTQQSKYFPDKAAVRSRNSAPAGLPPWQDWGQEPDPVHVS